MKESRYIHLCQHAVEKFLGFWGPGKYRPLVAFHGGGVTLDLLSGRQSPSSLDSLDEVYMWFQKQLKTEGVPSGALTRAMLEVRVGKETRETVKMANDEMVQDDSGHRYLKAGDPVTRESKFFPVECECTLVTESQTHRFKADARIDQEG